MFAVVAVVAVVVLVVVSCIAGCKLAMPSLLLLALGVEYIQSATGQR